MNISVLEVDLQIHPVLFWMGGGEMGQEGAAMLFPPLFGMDVSLPGQAVLWKWLTLSSLVRSPLKKAIQWASGAPLWGTERGRRPPERDRKQLIPVPSPGLGSLPSKELSSVGTAHPGSAGRAASEPIKEGPRAATAGIFYPYPSPSRYGTLQDKWSLGGGRNAPDRC